MSTVVRLVRHNFFPNQNKFILLQVPLQVLSQIFSQKYYSQRFLRPIFVCFAFSVFDDKFSPKRYQKHIARWKNLRVPIIDVKFSKESIPAPRIALKFFHWQENPKKLFFLNLLYLTSGKFWIFLQERKMFVLQCTFSYL